MSKWKDKSRPRFGELASDFVAQWNASKSEPSPAPTVSDESIPGASLDGGSSDIQQVLRSWKKGGGEVKVTKGKSAGYVKRQKKPAVTPFGRESNVVAPKPAIVIPAPLRVPRHDPAPVPKSLRQRLLEASADLHELRIAASMSHPRGVVGPDPVIEDQAGRLAILGLDFGTAFTKAVVRWSGRHHAVDWSNAVEGEDHHLLASVFSEAADGRCVLGAHDGAGWSVREGIKLQLLTSDATSADGGMADAVIFIALAFRYVDAWLRRTHRDVDKGVRWRLHVGLPTKSWDNDATTETFKRMAQAARVLACMSRPVTRTAALEALSMTDQVDRPAVDVFPEFACQLYSYLQSPERRGDLHALVDIGAGTLDVAYFNVFM